MTQPKKEYRKRILTPGNTDLTPMEIGKLPPQAIDMEEMVLGAVLLEDHAYQQVADMLIPDIFYKEQNMIVCQAIIALKDRNYRVDIRTVTEELKKMGELERVGGAYYVSNLTSRIASSANIEFHLRVIMEKYVKRESIRSAVELIKEAYEDSSDPFDVLNQYEKNLTSLTAKLFIAKSSDTNMLFHRLLDENKLMREVKGLTGNASGFHDLDVETHGWQRSDLIILAARPGMGKTALAIQMGWQSAVFHGKKIGVFSLEMSDMQIFKRICSQMTRIPLEKFMRAGLDDSEVKLLIRDTEALLKSKLFIDDTGGQTFLNIRSKARKWKREHDIDVLIVDYLQLVEGENEKGGNREQDISRVSRGLKSLAKELNIPVIALSQLSRKVEERPGNGKIPQLSDLRDSGSIEQDADLVAFLYRPEYYKIEVDADNQPTKGMAKVIIAKNRHGALTDVDLRFEGECTLFKDFNVPLDEKLKGIENNKDFLTNNLPY